MRIKEGFVLREICGQNVVSGEGLDQVNFSKLITLNPTATLLWQKAEKDGDFTVDSLAEVLIETFPEVEKERLVSDTAKLVKQWVEMGLISD